MSQEKPRFPEYELAGDYAAARRIRRAFRFAVAAIALLTLSLWISERYLRYDLAESQYRMALTLQEESARAVLRNVVKRDQELNDVPTARYVEALAGIEETDMVLSRYEEAYQLNPNNGNLLLNYGCRLFLNGKYTEARERFLEAGIRLPDNALPNYLQAAALIASVGPEEDLSEALTLVARANNSTEAVLFPQPLWHASMPRKGAWHAMLKRRLADQCCAPLYRLKSIVISRAENDLEKGQLHDWDSWLERLENMGAKLLGDRNSAPEHLGLSQAILGLQFQYEAVDLRNTIHQRVFAKNDESLIARKLELARALDQLKQFQGEGEEQRKNHRELFTAPLILIQKTLGLFFLVYFLVYLLNKFVHAGKSPWTLPHNRSGKSFFLGGLGAYLLLLFLFQLWQHQFTAANSWTAMAELIWYALTAILILFGTIYPALMLPSLQSVVGKRSDKEDDLQLFPAARRSRRLAFIALMRRYYGVLMGGLIVVVCIWIIAYRVIESLYPIQLALLVSGLSEAELSLLRAVHESVITVQHAL